MEIKVDFYGRTSEKHPDLKGFANLTVGGIKIDNVAIKERDLGMGRSSITYQIPSIESGTNEDGTKNYRKIFEVKASEEKSQDAAKVVNAIKDTIEEAMKADVNEFNAQSATKEVEVEYDQTHVTSYARPVQTDKNPNLRAFADVYVGSMLKINNVALNEYEKDGKSEAAVHFNSRQVTNKEGEVGYKEQVYPIVKGMREAIKDATVKSYLYQVENQEKQSQKQKSEGEEM